MFKKLTKTLLTLGVVLTLPLSAHALITPSSLDIANSPTDEYCLTYEGNSSPPQFQWAACAASSTEDLDEAYNDGATLDIDAAGGDLAIDFNASGSVMVLDADTNSVTVTDGIRFDTTGTTSAFTDAIDVSDADITNAINIGANAIAGTNFSVTGAGVITSTGITDSGTSALTTLTATTGTITTLYSTALTAAAAGNTNLTVDAAGTGTVTIAGTSTGAITLGASTTVATGKDLTMTNGNLTLSAGGLDVTAGSGDGDAIDVVNLAASAAIDHDVTAATTAAQWDIDASTGSGNILDIAFSGAYTGDAITANMTNAVGANAIVLTGAGTRTVPLVTVTDVPTTSAPTLDLNLTPGAAVQAGIDIDVAGTTAADIVAVDFSAAHTGTAFLATMANAVAGTAFEAVGSGTRTAPLVILTDTGDNGGSTIDLNSTKSHATGGVIDIDEAGTSAADILSIDFAAAHTGDAVNITTTNMGAAGQAIVVDGSIANSGAIVDLSTSGISTAAGSVLKAATSTQPGAANVGLVARFLDTGAAQATSYVLQLDSTNNEALNVSTGKAHFAEAATFLGSNKEAVRPNYVQAGGMNNAITVAANADDTGTNIPLADGLCLLIDLNSLTLQAGANTLDYISGGAVSIVSHYNVASNIGTGYSANGFIETCYNSTSSVWMDMSQ